MLSIGIRSGQGFDKNTIKKFILKQGKSYDFDVIILGTNPGGLICAREAVESGMKTALVHWRLQTPAEEDTLEESRFQMMTDLEIDMLELSGRTRMLLAEEKKEELMEVLGYTQPSNDKIIQAHISHKDDSPKTWSRKVRGTKLDLKHNITNMSLEGMKYMHDVAVANEIARTKYKQPMSWGKMMEKLYDHIIERNWTILTDLLIKKISIYDGYPLLVDKQTVQVTLQKGQTMLITGEMIISAVEIHYTFPKHTAGARQFGINFDDFYRLSSSPGKTLVVSDSPLGLQCAGILASFHFPVDMVLTSHFFQETDKDIMDKIMKNLKEKGVNFLDCKMVLSVSKKKAGDRLVALLAAGHHKLKRMVEEYDTVLFTSKEHPDFDIFSTTALKREMERLNGIEISSEEKEFLKDVVVIPDMGDKASSEKVGRDVANSLFHREQPQKAQKIIPNILYTPIEYAYYGASENMAKKRIGSECFQVYSGYFHIQEILMGTVETEDTICFIKIVCMPKHDLVLGVHVLGDKADLIINKILENSTEKISITNLHPAIHNRFIELLDMGE